jgi:hypothetical protein
MKDLIEEKMIQYFKECSVDNYGQVRIADPYVVFKDNTKEVLEYLKTDRIISIKTYGGQYGSYQGFSLSYDILDESLEKKCREALKQNDGYKWAMSH